MSLVKTAVLKFVEVGKEYVENFFLTEEEEIKAGLLLDYFFDLDHDNPLDKSKGIMIIGSVGVGKTLAMRVIQRMLPKDMKFYLASCQTVVDQYDLLGEEGSEPYKRHGSYMFDDLGEEDLGKHYGKQVEVMEKVIMARYNLYQCNKGTTHFTTNFSPESFKERYGERAFDRLREMCTIIIWPNKTSKRSEGIIAAPRVEDIITISETKKRDILANGACNKFERYKSEGILEDWGSPTYNFLYRIGLLRPSDEERDEYKLRAEIEISKEADLIMNNPISRMERIEAGRIIEGLQDGTLEKQIISKAKKLALEDYFNRLIADGVDLKTLISQV